MRGEMSERVAIMTGGASGIGKALARELGERGCHVVVADIDTATLEPTVQEFRGAGFSVEGAHLDVSDFAAVQRLVNATKTSHGRIDYMFNNAGINVFAELRDTTLEDWTRLIDVNLKGVVNGVHTVLPIMREQGFGHIVNTASLAGLMPTPVEAAYSATKHAVVALSMALRVEVAEFGVDVSVICPGVIETPLIDNGTYRNYDGRDVFNRMEKRLKPMQPQVAAKKMMRGVDKNHPFIVVTGFAQVAWRLYRANPVRALGLTKLMLDDIRKSRTAH